MPCSDSSSSMVIHLDNEDLFKDFEYAKITCGREITGSTGLSEYLKGLELNEILNLDFSKITEDLKISVEEDQFILYMEFDALRSAIGLYLGTDNDNIDVTRCSISSIDCTDQGVEVALVVLPPKEMPKILPCSLGDQNLN